MREVALRYLKGKHLQPWSGGTTPPDKQLLQLPSPRFWTSWSDRGHAECAVVLYFFVRNDDLKALRFDRVDSELQAY